MTITTVVFAQPDADSTHAQFGQVVEHLEGRFPEAAEMLADAREELLAFITARQGRDDYEETEHRVDRP